MTKKSSDRFPLSVSSSDFPLADPKNRSTVHSFRVRLEQLRSRYSRVTGETYRLEQVDRDGPSELYQLVVEEGSLLEETHQGLTQFLHYSPLAIEQLTAAGWQVEMGKMRPTD